MLKKFIISSFILSTFLYSKEIAQIPEASGITYIKQSKSLVVANDEGYIYEITRKGKLLRKEYLGDYDLEGVVYDESTNSLLFCEEKKKTILIVDKDSFKIKRKVQISQIFKNKKILDGSNNSGLEAITMINGKVFLSNQSKKVSKSFLFEIDSIFKDTAEIVNTIHTGYIDIAGLSFHKDFLYMLSDKDNLLIKYDIKKEKTVKVIKLQKFAQEGITFDDSGYVYIADDKGSIKKFNSAKLGI